MERFEGKVMATEDTSCSLTRDNEWTLSILDDDAVWEILVFLSGLDLLMVHMVVPQWRHVTSRLLKRQVVWRSIPTDWLKNENLHEWKLLLEVCTNLQELHLHELENLELEQTARILECISRLCNNLKVLNLKYNYPTTPRNVYAGKALKIDTAGEQHIFPWIPGWRFSDQQEVILTSQMLEPKSRITNSVLDWIKRILDKLQPYIRDPYWFSMMFQRRKMYHTTKCSGDVARLQSITLGICESKTKSKHIMKQWRQIGSYAVPMVFTVDEDFPNAVETICRVLRLSEQLNDLSRALPSPELFTQVVLLQNDTEREEYKCRCCACWSSDICRAATYCGYCSSKLALYEWNAHWTTEYKHDWNFDWSNYQQGPEMYHRQCDVRNNNTIVRERDILNSFR